MLKKSWKVLRIFWIKVLLTGLVNMLKAFECGEDLYAAENAAQALELIRKDSGDYEIEPFEIHQLSDEELDRLIPDFDENENPTGGQTCIRKWLEDMNEPGWLAGTL